MHKTILMVLLGVSAALFAGCEEKGPMERAGENVDRAVDDAGDAIDDATER